GLQKVLLQVRIPEPNGSVSDVVLDVQGMGGQGGTVLGVQSRRWRICTLTPYLHKVLKAQRFGVPYPYEILRMLTARPGASADFPPGTFVEHDLDVHGHLEPVTREPGLNTANLVVGVLTNRTTKVPEGMS